MKASWGFLHYIMKLLFTADLHIKLGQKNVPVEWSKERFREFFKQLSTIATRCNLLVIGGDIFEKSPSLEELELYFELVRSIEIPCFIYAGNHESIKKHTTFFTYLKEVTKGINPKVTVIDEFYSYSNLDFVPYNKLKEFAAGKGTFSGNICLTHVRGDIPPFVKAEVDLSLFDRWDLVLAGDLHSYENSQRNILYPGSPVTTSFHRHNVDTGVIILDTETLTHEWIKLQLPQLIRKTIKAGEAMVPGTYDHVIYEVEGDMAELGAMTDNTLIDKKVVKRETETALILDPKLTLAQEVKEYLLYILMLDDAKADAIVQVLQDNLDKIQHD